MPLPSHSDSILSEGMSSYLDLLHAKLCKFWETNNIKQNKTKQKTQSWVKSCEEHKQVVLVENNWEWSEKVSAWKSEEPDIEQGKENSRHRKFQVLKI